MSNIALADNLFEVERRMFRKLIGDDSMTRIQKECAIAVMSNHVKSNGNGRYSVSLDVKELDVRSADKKENFTEWEYFREKYRHSLGVPQSILTAEVADYIRRELNGIMGIRVLQVHSNNLASLYSLRLKTLLTTPKGLCTTILCCFLPLTAIDNCRWKKSGHIDIRLLVEFEKEPCGLKTLKDIHGIVMQ